MGLFIIFLLIIHYSLLFCSLFTIHYKNEPLFTNHYIPSRPSYIRGLITGVNAELYHNLLTTSGLSIWMHAVISLQDAKSYDNIFLMLVKKMLLFTLIRLQYGKF